MLATLTKLTIKERTGTDLPIIHYHCPVKNLDKLEPASFRQVEVEMKKVAQVLRDNEPTAKIFRNILGKRQTEHLIQGKTALLRS